MSMTPLEHLEAARSELYEDAQKDDKTMEDLALVMCIQSVDSAIELLEGYISDE